MKPPLHTKITRLLGTRLPILASGLQWLANADYVAAAAGAGIAGFITARSFDTPEKLRDEIRRCRDLCGSDRFGVNISMLPVAPAQDEGIERLIDVIAAEAVPFVETAGRNPVAYLPALHAAGALVIHKVPSLRHALTAEKIGVDAVCLVGAEAGGHPSSDQIGTLVQATLMARQITIPKIAGGGIGTGEQIVAALALGVDGVAIGTRFLVADEIWADRAYKDALVHASESSTTLVMQSLRNTTRVLANDTSSAVQEMERDGATLDQLMPLIAGRLGCTSYASGDASKGILSLGQAVGFADRIESLIEIVRRIETEMRVALARIDALRDLNSQSSIRKRSM
jgi:NAD(P)H-dependent flavin oxidoreductase YrpB (nitropropane dioxygenase family)